MSAGFVRMERLGRRWNVTSANYACVVIGAGVRLPLQRLADFEAVVNAIHRAAPAATIAFNTRPEDSADAAARWLTPGRIED